MVRFYVKNRENETVKAYSNWGLTTGKYNTFIMKMSLKLVGERAIEFNDLRAVHTILCNAFSLM